MKLRKNATKADFETDCVNIWNFANTPLKYENSWIEHSKSQSENTSWDLIIQ